MDHPLYGKRKKKVERCPNPLFVQWLTEWRDDAAEKGMKSQYTYGKALKSLKKFPLTLESGKGCKMLENFGDKICKMLDDRLAEHIAEHGRADPVAATNLHSVNNVRLKKSKPSPPAMQKPIGRTSAHDLSDSSGGEEPPPAKKRVQPCEGGGHREYIPQYRSGPYALLVTLYKDMQSPESRGFMTKTDLVTKAQPLADKSFTEPDPGSRYTAWSSMGALVKKGLVIKDSSPARYSLTDSGCELAAKLLAVVGEVKSSGDLSFRLQLPDPPVTTATIPRLPALEIDSVNDPSEVELQAGNGDRRLRYWYVTADGREVLEKDEAAVSVNDDMEVGFLVKCSYRDLLQAGIQYTLDTDRAVCNDYVYAYLHNNDTEDVAMPPHVPAKKQGSTNTAAVHKNNTLPKRNNSTPVARCNSSSVPPLAAIDLDRDVGNTPDAIVIDSEESSLSSFPSETDNGVNNKDVEASLPTGLNLMDRLAQKAGRSKPGSLTSDSQQSSQQSIKSLTSVESGASQETQWEPDFVLLPGQFDIVLCLDNAEFYGAGKSSSKNLLPDLIKNGISCDLRKLHVGDILWVARERVSSLPGHDQIKGRELVLNYIIERKRMDDLVGSCIDGRFKEQKFRLKKCGLQHAMYLVEDYGSMQHFSLPESTLKQAIVNTQVIDGFQIKRTRDTKETVAFLTVFTRYLQSLFKDKSLYACSLDHLRDTCIQHQVGDTQHRLPMFHEFNQSSVKSKSLTVQEMFGKQLIQLHGMSAEKARAVLDTYPTLNHLFEAYDRCISEREKEVLLANIKCGKSARSLGQGQSKQIYQLYNTASALT